MMFLFLTSPIRLSFGSDMFYKVAITNMTKLRHVWFQLYQTTTADSTIGCLGYNNFP